MTPKKAQKLQDEIFRKMPADKKLEIASQLWQLGKELNKSNNGSRGSKTPPSRNRKNS